VPNGGAPVVVVGSGKGGSGTSVVATMLALSAAGDGHRVLLVDGDEFVGPLRYLLGVSPVRALADLRDGAGAAGVVTPVSATLDLVAGGPGAAADRPATGSAERRALFKRLAALYAGYALIVVDGGSRLDTVTAACEAGAARLVAVTGTDGISLAAAYALVKAVATRSPTLAAEVLVSRQHGEAAARAFEHVDAATRHFLERPVRFAGSVPEDSCLAGALAAGMTLQDAVSGSPAAEAAHALVARLVADLHGTTERASRGGLFGATAAAAR
jgi:MinD-like ATPase involved in chromosome partitioning or flagellar assembly